MACCLRFKAPRASRRDARLASDCAATLYRVGFAPTGSAMKSFSFVSVHIAFSFRELAWRNPPSLPEGFRTQGRNTPYWHWEWHTNGRRSVGSCGRLAEAVGRGQGAHPGAVGVDQALECLGWPDGDGGWPGIDATAPQVDYGGSHLARPCCLAWQTPRTGEGSWRLKNVWPSWKLH